MLDTWFDRRIIYILAATLLICASLNINVVGGIKYNLNSQNYTLSPISTAENQTLEINETFVVDEWRREIIVDAWGGVSSNDYYAVFNNKSEEIYRMTFYLPSNASGISIQDAYGNYPKTSITESVQEDHIQIDLTLREPLKPGERNEFLITYNLPSEIYLSKNGWQDYTLELTLTKPASWIIKKFSLVITLPEGAEVRSFSKPNYKIEKHGLAVRIITTENDVVEFQNPSIILKYQYFILWGVFRPLIWAGLFAAIGAAFFFLRRSLHPKPAVAPIPPSAVGEFIEAYEEKRRLSAEIESLQRQFRSGRISRRRLRIRRRSLERKLASINKRLVDLKEQLITSSRRYEEMLNELETAEAEIETINADIERVEARFRRGEISAAVRQRLLDEYSRIKKRAESTISEILVRLEEGI